VLGSSGLRVRAIDICGRRFLLTITLINGSYMIDPDYELVVFNETDLARKIDKRMTPGKYLRNLREATGMTQKQVGEMTGKRSSYISDLETGQREIGKKVAKKLAEIFNVSPAVFI